VRLARKRSTVRVDFYDARVPNDGKRDARCGTQDRMMRISKSNKDPRDPNDPGYIDFFYLEQHDLLQGRD